MSIPVIDIKKLVVIAERTNNIELKKYLKGFIRTHYDLIEHSYPDKLYHSNEDLINDNHVIPGYIGIHTIKMPSDKLCNHVVVKLWYGSFFENHNSTCPVSDPTVLFLPIEVLDISEVFSEDLRDQIRNNPNYCDVEIHVDFSFRRNIEVTETELRQYGKSTSSLEPDKLQVKNSIQKFLKEGTTINSIATFDKWQAIPAVISIESLDDSRYSVGLVVFFPHVDVEAVFGFTCDISDLSVLYSLFSEENVLMAAMSNTNFSIRINFTI